MDKFTKLTGVAAPLPIVNVDTDMIIPKDYLKTIKRTGLASGLFAEMRFNEDGSENPDFVLNKPAYRKAQILVAGDNFGCGSSREHAPWALLDFGIRCVISTSFADIFYNNCFKNGILPITVSPEDLEKLLDDASRGSNATLSIDLEAKEIRGPDGGVIRFDLDDFKRHCLLNGLDDIGLTLEKAASIDSFEKRNVCLAALGVSLNAALSAKMARTLRVRADALRHDVIPRLGPVDSARGWHQCALPADVALGLAAVLGNRLSKRPGRRAIRSAHPGADHHSRLTSPARHGSLPELQAGGIDARIHDTRSRPSH